MQKTASKILFLAEVMNESGSQYNDYTCTNFKSQYLKTTLGTFFEKTMHNRGPKLGSYVSLTSFSGIFEKKNFRFLWAKMFQ